MRLPLLLLAVGACATDPGTSPGTLTRASDLVYQCDDSSGSFSCGTQVQLASGQLTASAQDQIDGLIAKLPLDTPDTVHEAGCGGAPLRSTTFSIDFQNGAAKDYTFEYGTGVASQIDDFVLQLVRQINACAGDSVTLDSCTPNTQPQL